MTSALLDFEVEEDLNFNNKFIRDGHHERDFWTQQLILLLQQANWLNKKNRKPYTANRTLCY
jgi:hypothetical protein